MKQTAKALVYLLALALSLVPVLLLVTLPLLLVTKARKLITHEEKNKKPTQHWPWGRPPSHGPLSTIVWASSDEGRPRCSLLSSLFCFMFLHHVQFSFSFIIILFSK